MSYVLNEKTEIPALHSILLVSNAFGYGRFPKPWEEIEQHLSISETGEVRVNGYGWSFGEDELEMFDSPELQEWLKTHTLTKPNANGYRRLRSERIRISPADARFLLSVIGLMIGPVLIVDEVTDVGTWELTATDINGKKHKDFGPLYGRDTRAMESRYGIRVSDLFRRVLGMDDLFMFDGVLAIRNIGEVYYYLIVMAQQKACEVATKMINGELLTNDEEQFLLTKLKK